MMLDFGPVRCGLILDPLASELPPAWSLKKSEE